MASWTQKFRLVALSTAHTLLDKAIDLNSIGALKQYIRDLEGSVENLEDASVKASGHVRTVTRDVDQTRAKIEELNKNVDFILGDRNPDNDHLATAMEAELISYEESLGTQQEELVAAQQTAQQLNETVSKLRAKQTEMVMQLKRLEAMDQAAKAKETAAEALRHASKTAAADVSVDNVTRRMQERNDVADERLKRAMGEATGSVEQSVVVAQAEARIAARKAKLATKQ